MLIGVDATCWHNTRGYGRHTRGLLSTLVRLDTERRYFFFVDSSENLDTLPAEAEIRLVRNSVPTAVAASADGHRSLRNLWSMSRAMADARIDLLLFPTIYSYVPVISRAKKIVMIHDVIPEMYPELTLPKRTGHLFWKAKVALGRWQADAIVTVSDYSRQGILATFGFPPERVFVVGEASDAIFRVLDQPQPCAQLRALGILPDSRLVVYVGGFGPHKNLEALLLAFARLAGRPQSADLRLVLVGEYEKEVFHSTYHTLEKRARELGVAGQVIFTGYLADEDLVGLLNLATVLVLPSLIEGFGLPAVEAAACGCPVIATSASPLPGLLGAAALYIDPANREELQSALGRVLESQDLRRQMRGAGLAAARQLTWEAAARQMLGVFEQVRPR
jgi:glycosyltransferase involved in cell wall biosynthesis